MSNLYLKVSYLRCTIIIELKQNVHIHTHMYMYIHKNSHTDIHARIFMYNPYSIYDFKFNKYLYKFFTLCTKTKIYHDIIFCI